MHPLGARAWDQTWHTSPVLQSGTWSHRPGTIGKAYTLSKSHEYIKGHARIRLVRHVHAPRIRGGAAFGERTGGTRRAARLVKLHMSYTELVEATFKAES
jgi:hypothetical protein